MRARLPIMIFVASLVLAMSGAARAQGSYQSTPIGGRSALMGGTGFALARDGSAPFLNPATIASVADSSVAFSVNFYTFSTTHFTNYYEPGAVDRSRFGNLQLPDTSLNAAQFSPVPSTLCLFLTIAGWSDEVAPTSEGTHRKGRKKLAACLGNLERASVGLTATSYHGTSSGFQSTQTQSLSRDWNRLYVGPTYSAYLTDDLAIGISLHGISTTYASSWMANGFTSNASNQVIASGLDASSSGTSIELGAIVGIKYHLDKVYTLGLSVETPSIHVFGTDNTTFSTQYSGAGQAVALATGSGSFSAAPPVRVGAGLGAQYGRLVLETDASFYFPRDEATRAELHVTQLASQNGSPASSKSFDAVYAERVDPVLNSAFGVEYYLRPSISVLGGVSTDFSAVARLTAQPTLGAVALSQQHRVAASLGIGSYGDGSELLFGTELSYGWGQAYAVNQYVLPNQFSVVDQSTFAVLLVVAGSTSLSTLKRTVTNLTHIVTQ